jgi:hypothetical protein
MIYDIDINLSVGYSINKVIYAPYCYIINDNLSAFRPAVEVDHKA